MKLALEGNVVQKTKLMQDIVWVGVPMLSEGFRFTSIDSGYGLNDIRLKIVCINQFQELCQVLVLFISLI